MLASRSEIFETLDSLEELGNEAAVALDESAHLLETVSDRLQPSSSIATSRALTDAIAAVSNFRTVLGNCRRDV